MKDEIKTSAPATDAAPAAPKPVPKPAPKPRDPYIRAENEDDDGYDPYSDRRPEREPLFEADQKQKLGEGGHNIPVPN